VVGLVGSKATIGPGPDCTLPLGADGDWPVHFLVIRGCHHTVVRGWSPKATLNGRPLFDAAIRTGDILDCGDAALEVLDLAAAEPPQEVAEPPARLAAGPPRRDSAPSAESLRWQLRARETSRLGRRRIRSLVRRVRQAERSLKDLVERAKRVELESDENSAAPDATPGHADLLRRESDLSQALTEMESTQEALGGKARQLADLSASLADREATLHSMACELSTAKQSLADRERSLTQDQEQLLRDREEVRGEHRRIEALREELDSTRRDLEARRAEVDQLHEEQRRQLEQDRLAVEEKGRLVSAEMERVEARLAEFGHCNEDRREEPSEPPTELVSPLAVGSDAPAAFEDHRLLMDAVAKGTEALPAADDGSSNPGEWSSNLAGTWPNPEGESPGSQGARTMTLDELRREMGSTPLDEEECRQDAPPVAVDVAFLGLNGDAPPATGEAAAERRSVVVPPSGNSEAEEESIDDYMSRLLARLKGEGGTSSSRPAVSAPVTATAPPPMDIPSASAPATAVVRPGQDMQDSPPAEPRRTNTVTASELAAMRNLANMTARQAIASHTRTISTAQLNFRLLLMGGGFLTTVVFLAWGLLSVRHQTMLLALGGAGIVITATGIALVVAGLRSVSQAKRAHAEARGNGAEDSAGESSGPEIQDEDSRSSVPADQESMQN
jgi:hypothetical protein